MKCIPYLLGIASLLFPLSAFSQCSTSAPTNAMITATGMTGITGLTWSTWATAPTGCPTTGTSITNGSTISGSSGAGSIYYVSGGSTVSATLSMNASDSIRIIVCGGGILNLTRGGSVNSTKVGLLVMPGGTLRTTSSLGFPGKHWLYGAYVPSVDFTIQDGNTNFFVAPTGIFQLASDLTTGKSLTLNSSTLGLYTEGAFDVYNFTLNSAPTPFLCMNSASACIRVRGTYSASNSDNQVQTGTNGGTLKLDLTSGTVSFNKKVSSSSNLRVCAYGATYCDPSGTKCCTADCGVLGSAYNSATPFPNVNFTNACTAASLPANCNIPLAVKLIYFHADNTNEGVKVSWAASVENRTGYYKVEKSKDNTGWETIGEIKADGSPEYTLSDYKQAKGYTYYRLIEVEESGKETLEAVTMVKVENPNVLVRLYPNPSHGSFNIEVSDEYPQYQMEVLDITGKLVSTYTLSPGNTTISDIEQSGLYIVRLKINSEVKTLRLSIQRD